VTAQHNEYIDYDSSARLQELGGRAQRQPAGRGHGRALRAGAWRRLGRRALLAPRHRRAGRPSCWRAFEAEPASGWPQGSLPASGYPLEPSLFTSSALHSSSARLLGNVESPPLSTFTQKHCRRRPSHNPPVMTAPARAPASAVEHVSI
jgi:hypothetical protein